MFSFIIPALLLLIPSALGYEVPQLTMENFAKLAEGKTIFVKAFAPCKFFARGDWCRF